MDYQQAKYLADSAVAALVHSCARIKICGSIRRQSANPHDIDLVVIPKRIEQTDLFGEVIGDTPVPEFIHTVNSWPPIKGDPTGRLCVREYHGLHLEISIARPENFGYLVLIRTGPADFSHRIASHWRKVGYQGEDGMLTRDGKPVAVREEEDLFRYLGLEFIEPIDRK